MRRKITLFSSPEKNGYDAAVMRLKSCINCIDEYLQTHNNNRKQELLYDIDRLVPRGIYMPALGTASEAFVVLGVRHRSDRATRESAFYVAYAPLSDIAAEATDDTLQLPLIETDGFLYPVVRDDYRGERYVRIGVFLE